MNPLTAYGAPAVRKCQKCGHRGEDVRIGPCEPRLLCNECWADSKPLPKPYPNDPANRQWPDPS